MIIELICIDLSVYLMCQLYLLLYINEEQLNEETI